MKKCTPYDFVDHDMMCLVEKKRQKNKMDAERMCWVLNKGLAMKMTQCTETKNLSLFISTYLQRQKTTETRKLSLRQNVVSETSFLSLEPEKLSLRRETCL